MTKGFLSTCGTGRLAPNGRFFLPVESLIVFVQFHYPRDFNYGLFIHLRMEKRVLSPENGLACNGLLELTERLITYNNAVQIVSDTF